MADDVYYSYLSDMRRLQRHWETFINNIEVSKILPDLVATDAFTKGDEQEVSLNFQVDFLI